MRTYVHVSLKGSPRAIFWRAIELDNLVVAETTAREFPTPPDHALALVHLYGRKGSRRYEAAALRYLERYLSEANPSLEDVAGVANLLVDNTPG
jgi:hypothetical protein